ncbi:hypothetical protein THRCLA_03480 [Thraustotheca clavata]|uniref:Uncharacterized protein n=1 Tax=Thraustotheca clavata TaxID=74557 RepID=A0A1W0A1Z0_9STRA|nr:hypothetical protein THRCLA_03480 [Thraustotheca clavata]
MQCTFLEVQQDLFYCPLAEFSSGYDTTRLEGELVVADPISANIPLKNAKQITGKLVLVQRGECDFLTKALHAQKAGAIGIIVANTDEENPHVAFVMDSGQFRARQITKIPAIMAPFDTAQRLLDLIGDTQSMTLQIALVLLDATEASAVLDAQEQQKNRRLQEEEALQKQQERERKQREAKLLLRSRLTKDTTVCKYQSSPSFEVPFEVNPLPAAVPINTKHDAIECNPSLNILPHPAIPIEQKKSFQISQATSLLILDLQYYCAVPHVGKFVNQDDLNDYYFDRIRKVVVPNIQQLLQAFRSRSWEIIYGTIESATKNGRDRSKAHKLAGIHVPKNSFEAKVLDGIAPSEYDIVIPRTAVSLFSSTNTEYILRNLNIWRNDPQDTQEQLAFSHIHGLVPIEDEYLKVEMLNSSLILRAESSKERNLWLTALGEAIFCRGAPPGAEIANSVIECMRNGCEVQELENLLRSQGSCVLGVDDEGNSVLLMASKLGAPLDTFQLLLRYGADPNLVNEKDESALLVLSAAGECEIVELLIQHGVKINQKCSNGMTTLHTAASTGEIRMLQLLVAHGGNLFEIDDRGWSCLHHASAYSYGADTVKWICTSAPSLIDWPDYQRNTSLHIALHHGHRDIAQILVENRANAAIINDMGEDALAIAKVQNYDDLVDVIQVYVQPNESWIECQTEDGYTYYYNEQTGESSWYLPTEQSKIYPSSTISDDEDNGAACTGDFALCMAPVISPLQALDNPDAITKEMHRRKKERQQRRRRKNPPELSSKSTLNQ